ncbi:MAG TPA: hypothetical protein VHK90_04805, partial [Thermoanaerobaculia bacterium]|nr:hypothetical protein [Thermoanaerobaculia bacterium]
TGGLKPAAPQVTPVEHGQLLINALPWGQVTSVQDEAGRERLTAPAETPLVLTLPAGMYKVQLTNPNSNRSRSLTAIVRANDLSRYEAELDQVDAGDYVNSLGIGQ